MTIPNPSDGQEREFPPIDISQPVLSREITGDISQQLNVADPSKPDVALTGLVEGT